MINFFRRIRKNMLAQNKFAKYITYALGEIFLVVIGILIALQINTWNEEKIQEQDLNDILQSVANGVQSDLRELNLVSAARINIRIKSDSIFNTYSQPDKQTLNIEEASYINLAFQNSLNTVHLNTNLSAFESLKNSIYFSKIQGTELALLLSTYYSSAHKLRNLEDVHNQSLKILNKASSLILEIKVKSFLCNIGRREISLLPVLFFNSFKGSAYR